ncbi:MULTISPECIES: ATP-grasp domain-containing protein [unclassified Lysobacter]|uniref:ATP-grasp domain-containing protein n=1 Tax=unclassified Lysobacter TaxID=2635362 RepID=UPI0006F9AA88|nr:MULTISPECIES: ATP-grasp domain-containing protein [unclassified Lysobacter]KRA17747.1 hypothetical protein ASD69_13850 [Lysobacter sp. Root604]KRD34084.1 hypothetical protein ASE35_10075 [Lysobacter sp. Root916]KRD77426.1 hypothetical protein ASE43_09780 [Lysobacter sp. Root983]
MPTLILTPRQTEDSRSLWKAANALGWSTERLGGWRLPDHVVALPDPVLYAEALFAPDYAETLGLTLLSPSEDWLVRLPMKYKHRHIRLTTLQEARKLEVPMFVKPPNDKSFPAGVYGGADLPIEYDGDTPVLVSDVVQWNMEFRCFVLNRVLHTYSIYSRNGDLQRDTGFSTSDDECSALEAFMAEILADPSVEIPNAVVIDVGTLDDGRWACVEQNAAWGSGIYGCDPVRVLEVVRAASFKKSE